MIYIILLYIDIYLSLFWCVKNGAWLVWKAFLERLKRTCYIWSKFSFFSPVILFCIVYCAHVSVTSFLRNSYLLPTCSVCYFSACDNDLLFIWPLSCEQQAFIIYSFLAAATVFLASTLCLLSDKGKLFFISRFVLPFIMFVRKIITCMFTFIY